MSKPVTTVELNDRYYVVNAFVMHYSLISFKAELDQLVKGLEAYGLIYTNQQTDDKTAFCSFQTTSVYCRYAL